MTAKGNNILLADNKIMTGWSTGVNIQGSNCRVTNNVMDGNIIVTGDSNQIDDNSGCDYIGVGAVQSSGIFSGSHNLIKNNTCQGLSLTYSDNNVLIGNSLLGNSWEPSFIDITYSNNNLICENQIIGSNFGHGLRLFQSSNNTIQANAVTGFLVAGASFSISNNNLFTLNNFYGSPNSYAPYVSGDLSTNVWSLGHLGNYWGDYLTKYPDATEVGNSGVGNLPYVINDNNTDAYPLMSRYDISSVSIQLPDWTNLAVPSTIPTPAFTSSQPSTTTLPLGSTPSSDAASTSAVPELAWLAIAPLTLSVFIAAVLFLRRHRKIPKNGENHL